MRLRNVTKWNLKHRRRENSPLGEAALRGVMVSRGWSNKTLKLTFTEEPCSLPTEPQSKIPLTFGQNFSSNLLPMEMLHDAPALDSWISRERDRGKHPALFPPFWPAKGATVFFANLKTVFFFHQGMFSPFASWPQPFWSLLVPVLLDFWWGLVWKY